MKTFEELKERLIKEEGLKLKPYRCTAGKLTIGVGRNLEDRGITETEALFLLENDINIIGKELVSTLPWLEQLPNEAFLIIMDMAFNMGVSGLLEFKNTLKCVKEGKYKQAAVEMLDSHWAGQVPMRAKGLSDLMAEIEA